MIGITAEIVHRWAVSCQWERADGKQAVTEANISMTALFSMHE